MMLVVAGFVSSCNKDEDPAPTGSNKSNSEKLVGKNWKITAATLKDPSGATTDEYADMEACDKDDLYIYNANGTYVLDAGATKCDPNDPQTEPGVWSMNSGQTVITQDGFEFTIKSMTETQMVLEFVIDLGGGDMTYTTTFTKQ